MRFYTSIWFGFAVFWSCTFAQFDTTTTVTAGHTLYIPTPGSTSTVAAPASIPTLIYNCFQMPLICENVAAWAKTQFPIMAGDLPGNQLFHFDPLDTAKEKRRQRSCGCFQHDNCPSTTSDGKQPGVAIPDIALGPAPPIDPASQAIILAGVNPSPSTQRGVIPVQFNPRVALNSIPGRFYGQGIVYSCDEFPAATWIQGGGGASTICALQNWKINTGVAGFDRNGNPTNVGKWPLTANSAGNQEQDWQAASHVILRKLLGINRNNPGTGTVFPFFMSTTTSAVSSSKAWVILNAATKIVTKRDAVYTLPPTAAPTTMVITGEETGDHLPLARRANPGAILSTSSSSSSSVNGTTTSSTSRFFVSRNSTTTSSAKTTRPSTILASPTSQSTDAPLSIPSSTSSGGAGSSTQVSSSSKSTPSSSAKSSSSNTGVPINTSSNSRSSSSSFNEASSTSSSVLPQGTGGVFTAPITIPPSGTRPPIVIPPQTTTYTGPTSLETLSTISGVSGSFSATTTTDSNNNVIILPIWFGPLGIIVIPTFPGPFGIIPPPPGFPPVFIGSDGKPTKSPDNEPTDASTKPQSTSRDSTTTGPSTTSASTTSFSSSSSSSSSSQAGPSSCTLAFDQDGDEDVDVGDEGFDDIDIGTFPTISFSSSAPTSASGSFSATSSGFTTSTRSSSQGSSTSSSTQSSVSPTSTGQLTCNQVRPSGSPSGDDIAAALTSNGSVDSICAAKFDGSGTPTSETFNHGLLFINVQRGSTSEQLTFCQTGLNTIIDTCIKNGGSYGGIYIQGTQVYNISNSAYPNNPLIPGVDPGADPVSSSAIPTSSAEPCASGCFSDINGNCKCSGPGPVIITTPLPTPTPTPAQVSCPAGCAPAGGSCLCDGDGSPPPVQTIPANGGDGGDGGFGPCDLPIIGLFCP